MIPRWSTLKRLSSGPSMRYTSMVPFLGAILVSGASHLPKLLGSNLYDKLELSPNQGFSRLLIGTDIISSMLDLYIGFALLGFSYIFYVWFCPECISAYVDLCDFVRLSQPLDTPSSINSMYDAAKPAMGAADYQDVLHPKKYSQGSISLNQPDSFPREEWSRINQTAIVDIKTSFYNHENSKFAPARTVCIVLFILGSMSAFIPAVRTLVRVFLIYLA